jgi:hypothetical protein
MTKFISEGLLESLALMSNVIEIVDSHPSKLNKLLEI